MAPTHPPDKGIQPSKPATPAPAPSATGIQAQAPAAPAAAATAPKPKPIDPAILRRRLVRAEHVLIGMLLLLAFFLGSFAVTNSDFWMHLATGRLIATGQYGFGDDPFSYATETIWVNHAWLYDLIVYLLYCVVGGPGLVILKSLLVVALVWVLLQMRRPEQSWCLPVLVIGLALLALSPRLWFGPTCVSFLFLAITLRLLLKPPGKQKAERLTRWVHNTFGKDFPAPARHLWWLPVLFLAWVNLDAWFALGPLTVGLVWLGTWLQARSGQAVIHAPRSLGLIFAV